MGSRGGVRRYASPVVNDGPIIAFGARLGKEGLLVGIRVSLSIWITDDPRPSGSRTWTESDADPSDAVDFPPFFKILARRPDRSVLLLKERSDLEMVAPRFSYSCPRVFLPSACVRKTRQDYVRAGTFVETCRNPTHGFTLILFSSRARLPQCSRFWRRHAF